MTEDCKLTRSNTVHRHEPPITNDPILVLHKDEEKGYVMVSKPGSVVSSFDLKSYPVPSGVVRPSGSVGPFVRDAETSPCMPQDDTSATPSWKSCSPTTASSVTVS